MRILEKKPNEYPLIARIIFWVQKKKYGMSLIPTKLWGRSPRVLYGLQLLYRAIDRKDSPIEPSLRVLIGICVSQINSCSFCLDIGQSMLEARGVSLEKALNMPIFETDPEYTPRERAALAYADAMTRYDVGVSELLFGRVKEQFTDDEIVDLTAIIAYQNLSSKFNSALTVPAQGFCSVPSKAKS